MVKPIRLLFFFLVFFPSPAPAISEPDFFNQYRQNVLPFYHSCEQTFFHSSEKVKIRYLKHLSTKKETALVILPGKSESYIKYAELMYDLNAPGVSFFVLDHRGMGFSVRRLADRDKVFVEHFDHYVKDLKNFMDTVVVPQNFRNLFILGHSLGGTVALRYLESGAPEMNGVVLCSPMIRINTRLLPETAAVLITKTMIALGRGKKYALTQGKRKPLRFKNNPLTASKTRWHLWQEKILGQYPELSSGGATNRWVYESLIAGRETLKDRRKIKIPLLVLKAVNDTVVDPEAMDRLCDATRCEMVSFFKSGHEILMEKDAVRNTALERIKQFMQTHTKK